MMPDQRLRLIESSPRVDEALTRMFEDDIRTYRKTDSVPFYPDYTPRRGAERLRIDGFELPEVMHRGAARWHSRDKLEPDLIRLRGVKAIVAVDTEQVSGESEALDTSDIPRRRITQAAFKRIDKSRIIDQTVLRIVWDRETFDRIDGPGLTVPEGLDAFYEDRSLYFNSYQTANGFLDLTDWFNEASAPQIDEVMGEDVLLFDGEDTIHEFVNATCKRSLSMLWRSGRLRQIEVADVKEHANKYNVKIATKFSNGKEKVVVPGTNKEFKQLLDLLNQNYFPGIFDGEAYVANSKRPAT